MAAPTGPTTLPTTREFQFVSREPTEGAVCALPFLEGTGSTAHDISGNENDGSITGASWQSLPVDTETFAPYLALDGSGDVVEVADDATLDSSPIAIEIVCRMNDWASGSDEVLACKTASGDITWRLRKKSNDRLVFENESGSEPQLDVSRLEPTKVHHVVGQLDGDVSELFVDGRAVQPQSGGTVDANSAPIRIGGNFASGSNMYANMDVFAFNVYERRLSPYEILGLWTGHRLALGAVQGSTRWFDNTWTEQMAMDPENQRLDLGGSSMLKDPSNSTTGDGMTANPETDTEDGYIEVDIGGATYQIPIYNS